MQNYTYFTLLNPTKIKTFFALCLFAFTAVASFGQIQNVFASSAAPTWRCEVVHVVERNEFSYYESENSENLILGSRESCQAAIDQKIQNHANQFGLFIMSSPTQICPSGYNDCYCPSTVTNGQAKTISQGRTCGASISVNTNQTTQTIENARYCFIIDNEQCHERLFSAEMNCNGLSEQAIIPRRESASSMSDSTPVMSSPNNISVSDPIQGAWITAYPSREACLKTLEREYLQGTPPSLNQSPTTGYIPSIQTPPASSKECFSISPDRTGCTSRFYPEEWRCDGTKQTGNISLDSAQRIPLSLTLYSSEQVCNTARIIQNTIQARLAASSSQSTSQYCQELTEGTNHNQKECEDEIAACRSLGLSLDICKGSVTTTDSNNQPTYGGVTSGGSTSSRSFQEALERRNNNTGMSTTQEINSSPVSPSQPRVTSTQIGGASGTNSCANCIGLGGGQAERDCYATCDGQISTGLCEGMTPQQCIDLCNSIPNCQVQICSGSIEAAGTPRAGEYLSCNASSTNGCGQVDIFIQGELVGFVIDNTGDCTPTTTTTPPAATPPPTATQYSCNSTCTTDSQCQSADSRFTCHASDSGNRCRLSTNPASTTCQPAVGPMCISISMTNVSNPSAAPSADPELGDAITLTCGEVSEASRYIFRIVEPDGNTVNLNATGRTSQSYTITKDGPHSAQCQICTGDSDDSCLPYEPTEQ